jgi:hypothetical protein
MKNKQEKKTSGLAIVSLIFGICSILLGWIPYLGWAVIGIALISSIVALTKIHNDSKLNGKGLAIAGLVLACVEIVILAFILIGLMAIFGAISGVSQEMAQQSEQQSQATSNLVVDFNVMRETSYGILTVKVIGTVTNKGDTETGWMPEVEVDCYTSDDVLIETSSTYISQLKAGDKDSFKVEFYNADSRITKCSATVKD